MAIGIQTSAGGEFRQRIGYNAKSGRLNRVDRKQDGAGNWTSDDTDITDRAKFVMDLAGMRVGWVYFSATGPQKVMAPLGAPIPPRPDTMLDGKPAFKPGAEILVVLHKDCADGTEPLREFTNNSATTLGVIDALHDKFLAAPESKAGKLPVVALAGTRPIKTKHGTNYEPIMEIVGWVPRPAALDGASEADAEPALSPKAAKTAPQPAEVSEDDFG